MEYFKSGFKHVLGAQTGSQVQNEAEIVERLVDRVKTSTLLDDRRDACRALKALSKKFRLLVGTQAMDAMLTVLNCDQGDAEILGYALDTLGYVITGAPEEAAEQGKDMKLEEELGGQFTEIYIKRLENVSLLLDLLEEFDFRVRWPAVKLLTGLLVHRPKEVQECVLVVPRGVSRLMDLLAETRDVIRNDTLLLLSHLTRSNANIQKIVAFENAFDRLLGIIAEEGYSDGGVVVEDCLVVLLNLLKNNASNQNFFKEGTYIQKLSPFFNLSFDLADKGWSPQKLSCLHLMLQVLRTLVCPNNPCQIVSACQRIMNHCGLLEQLCNILVTSGVPANILTETVNTVAEVIRGHHHNQEYFASISASTTPPKPVLLMLLTSMVSEKQPFVLRQAVLYCFQSFLYRNELGQAQVVQTLLPSAADVGSGVTMGQLLCGGLFSPDPLAAWSAAVALAHALTDNVAQREQLLRVQLAVGPSGVPPVSLLPHCSSALHCPAALQARLGLLMLLCCWLAHCPAAVACFLAASPTNVPFLTSQVTLAEGDENEGLLQGVCAFLLGICIEFNNDSQPSFTRSDLCQLVEKRITLDTFSRKLGLVAKHESYSRVLQGPQLRHKQPSEVLLDHEFAKLYRSLESTIIKAVRPMSNGPLEDQLSPEQHAHLERYKGLIREQDQQLQAAYKELGQRSALLDQATAQCQDLSSQVQQLRDQMALLRAKDSVSTNSVAATDDAKVALLRQELEALRRDKETLEQCLARQQQQSVTALPSEEPGPPCYHQQVTPGAGDSAASALRVSELEQELQKQLEIVAELRREQEDLLVMLTDQDVLISKYKNRLRELDQPVQEDELEEEEDDASTDQS